MKDFALRLRDSIPTDVFTDLEVIGLVPGSPDRRYGLIKRALASGDLVQVRRGVYVLGKRFQRQRLNLFELAQRVYAPSYVSLESALSFHGWIPEAAYTVTSVCLKRSTSFDTPLGQFSYTRIPGFHFFGVERLQESRSVFLMAGPEKALMDYVLAYKVDVRHPSELLESLRIESDSLQKISLRMLSEIANAHGSRRGKMFVKYLRKAFE